MSEDRHEYYRENWKYTHFLESQDVTNYQKYADFIKRFTDEGDKILDVGCGTGTALDLLKREGIKRELIGVDISHTSLELCKAKGFDCQAYDGRQLPFEDEYFDFIGSLNVLEHTECPEGFLDEKLRVTKKGAHVLVACPNFLSVTNSYHHHTKGTIQKLRNLTGIIEKKTGHNLGFEKMEVIVRENFQPDDDACTVTNPLDILYWAGKNELELKYWSSQSRRVKGIVKYLDFSFMRLFLGGSFMVFKRRS